MSAFHKGGETLELVGLAGAVSRSILALFGASTTRSGLDQPQGARRAEVGAAWRGLA